MQADPSGRFDASLDVTLDLPLAGAASRGLARFVDGLIVFVLQLGVGLLFGLVLAGVGLLGVNAGVLVGIWLILVFVSSWFLSAALELYTRGQPPGKRLLGLRVVRGDGGTLTLGPALLRNLLRLDSFPGGLVLDLALMLFSEDCRRLGDLAAGTLVVVEERRPPVARRWPAVLGAADVALLEAWYQRAPDLPPDRRRRLATRITERIAAKHPDLVDPSAPPIAALEALAPREDAATPGKSSPPSAAAVPDPGAP